MWCEFNYKDEFINVIYPNDHTWQKYHVKKHLIKGYYKEGWNNVISYKKEFLDANIADLKDLESLSKDYIGYIKKIIKNDPLEPRNAKYDENGRKSMFMIIDNNGFVLILRKSGKNFFPISCYGFDETDTVLDDDIDPAMLKLDKLLSDNRRRLVRIVRKKNRSFLNTKRFQNVNKTEINNW